MAKMLIFRERGSRGFEPADLRMTLWLGALLGLLAVNIGWWTAPTPVPFDTASVKAPDPWAESRRSAALLRGQEAAPAAIPAATGGAAATASPTGLRVVDGDTFWLGGEKIRIADIDTPETNPPRCAHEAALGARATRRLEALLMAGPFELARTGDRDEDRYGRKLRIVTRGGRSLGDVLVAEGLARTWTGRREPWCG